MAELLTLVVRLAQVSVALAVIAIVFAPVLVWIWPYIWPWLLLTALLALYQVLDGIGNRLSAARELRDDW